MSIQIAIATEDGVHVSAHFGRAPYFQVVTIDNGKIVASERREKAYHQGEHHHDEHGGNDTHASGMVGVVSDCAVIIAGGMGSPAYESIQAAKLTPILTDLREVDQAAQAYAMGTLTNRPERVHQR